MDHFPFQPACPVVLCITPLGANLWCMYTVQIYTFTELLPLQLVSSADKRPSKLKLPSLAHLTHFQFTSTSVSTLQHHFCSPWASWWHVSSLHLWCCPPFLPEICIQFLLASNTELPLNIPVHSSHIPQCSHTTPHIWYCHYYVNKERIYICRGLWEGSSSYCM